MVKCSCCLTEVAQESPAHEINTHCACRWILILAVSTCSEWISAAISHYLCGCFLVIFLWQHHVKTNRTDAKPFFPSAPLALCIGSESIVDSWNHFHTKLLRHHKPLKQLLSSDQWLLWPSLPGIIIMVLSISSWNHKVRLSTTIFASFWNKINHICYVILPKHNTLRWASDLSMLSDSDSANPQEQLQSWLPALFYSAGHTTGAITQLTSLVMGLATLKWPVAGFTS